MRNNLSVINVYSKKNTKSKLVTQLLYGESFKITKKNRTWIKIKNDSDGYEGFILKKKFSTKQKNTHKVSVLKSDLYSGPNIKKKKNKRLSFDSRLRVVDKKGKFYKFDKLWIKRKDLKKIAFRSKDSFNNINQFVNVRYKWGGKHFSGVDCSGLIQLFLNFNNKFCPRDTKDQIKYFKKKINIKKIKKNDLIFWKNHVAIVVSKNKLIHAYGPLKKVVIMPVKKTIDRIYQTAKLKVVGVRRVS